MAVSAPALTTLANLKSALQIATADTTYDTLLEKVIDRATEWVEGRAERKLKARKFNGNASGDTSLTHPTTTVVSEDYVYFSGDTKDNGGDTVVDARGRGVFYLPAWPVRPNAETGSVTFALAVLSSRSSAGETWDTASLVEWQDYVVDRNNGVLTLTFGAFGADFRNYRVTMAAGYLYGSAQPYVPPDLEQLCIAVARKMFRNDYGLTSEQIGTWSRSYKAEQQDAYIESAIARYRRFSL